MNDKFSIINIRETHELKQVKIGSKLKPVVISDVIVKWQSLLDLIVKIIDVPSGLIMKLNESSIEVFSASQSAGNPYKNGEEAKLIYGLYCETVIGTQQKLLIPDATKSPVWCVNNPDVDINMISYLGFPVNWPDGEVFGTICLLDNKENHYQKTFEDLLFKVKQSIETDLELLVADHKLKEKNLQLEQLNATKDKFFSIIAHDLKSPFNSILGFSEMLKDEARNLDINSIVQYTDIIYSSSQHAFNLLENLLDWARMQQGNIPFEPRKLLLNSLVGDVIKGLKNNADQKDIRLIESLQNEIVLTADENMLNTLLRNLISNAIKFTPKGGQVKVEAKVEVEVEVENEVEDEVKVKDEKSKVVISVSDTGIGMTAETIGKLFKIETSFSTRGTENEKGTGLGLLLCKEFVEKHGGRIWVESKLGQGSTFNFSIPLIK